MKKILLSLGVILFVGAAAAGATGAFFSDNETSTGNTFTAGAIDLKVDDVQHYDGLVCVLNPQTEVTTDYWWQLENAQVPSVRPELIGTPCTGTWSLTDLGPSNQFFNYNDVKPGDVGENTVSLHVDNNPAYACAYIRTTSDLDNTYTQPEINAGDLSSTTGELAQNISLFAWLDTASTSGATTGDNIWQAGEPILQGLTTLSALGATTTLTLADGGSGSPLPGGSTTYIGIGWCAGTITIGAPGSWSCSGASMSNQAQTDSATADVTFHVEQQRNNAAFRCGGAVVAPAEIDVTANDLESNLLNAPASGKWYFYDDANDLLNNSLGGFVVGPSTPPLGTGSAQNNALAGASSRTLFTNSGFGGVVLSAITQLSYGDYQPSGAWSATEAPFFRFNVDFGTTTAYQGSLVFVPSVNGVVTQNTWQNWDMINGGTALWSYSRNFWPAGVTTATGTIAGTTARSWTTILADYPGIKMHALFPQLGFRTGEPGPAGLTANLDNFKINAGTLMTYDFGN